MVPEVDKKDTYVLLDDVRTQIETTRQQILGLELAALSGEKEALRQLAARSFQQARQWTGKMLGELGLTSHPYPNGSDASTNLIDPTTVTTDPSRPSGDGLSVIQRIKAARAHVKELDATLDELTARLIPGSRFNQFLFKAQEHALQAGMWLGELLAEHVELEPKAEAVAPGNESAPTSVTAPTNTDSGLGAESSPAAISPIMEAVLSDPYQTEIIKDLSLASTSTAKEDSPNSTAPSPTTPKPTESESAQAETSADSVRK